MTDVDADEELAPLRDRLAAMRRTLAEACGRRDALATEASVIVAAGGSASPQLLVALGAADRAVLAAEADMKDAQYALHAASDALAGSASKAPRLVTSQPMPTQASRSGELASTSRGVLVRLADAREA